jgi:hypothetical protein
MTRKADTHRPGVSPRGHPASGAFADIFDTDASRTRRRRPRAPAGPGTATLMTRLAPQLPLHPRLPHTLPAQSPIHAHQTIVRSVPTVVPTSRLPGLAPRLHILLVSLPRLSLQLRLGLVLGAEDKDGPLHQFNVLADVTVLRTVTRGARPRSGLARSGPIQADPAGSRPNVTHLKS